jgi:hypothetical protein
MLNTTVSLLTSPIRHIIGQDRIGQSDPRQGRCKLDHLLAKPDRAGSLPGQATNGADHGHRVVVRGCPLGTGRDCCEWHGSGTVDKDYVRGLAASAPTRPHGEARPSDQDAANVIAGLILG